MQHALKRTSLRRGEYVSIRDRDSDEIRTFRVGRDGGLIRRAAMRLT